MKNGSCSLILNKRLILFLFSIALIILFIGNILAVAASIGNARMILRAKVGDTIQKTILIKNINNETINIEVFPSGDLVKDIKILDSNFTLAPGEEKDARFTIKVTKNGAFENRINVKFISLTDGKGVVLSSNVVVMVNDGSSDSEINDSSIDDSDLNDSAGDDVNNNDTDSNTNNITKSPIWLLSITGVILLIFFVLLIVYYVRSGKKENIKEKSEENNELKKKKTKSKRDRKNE